MSQIKKKSPKSSKPKLPKNFTFGYLIKGKVYKFGVGGPFYYGYVTGEQVGFDKDRDNSNGWTRESVERQIARKVWGLVKTKSVKRK